MCGKKSSDSTQPLPTAQATMHVRLRCVKAGIPIIEEWWIHNSVNDCTTLLGEGGFGQCFLVLDNQGKQYVAKTFTRHTTDLLMEAQCLNLYRGVPGIQQLVGVCPSTLQVISEFAGFDTISRIIRSSAMFTNYDKLYVLKQVFTAVDRIHALGMCHNDLKSNNVCLRWTGMDFRATVIDLGLMRPQGTPVYCGEPSLRCYWIAPELNNRGRCSKQSDVYSLGFLVLEMGVLASVQLQLWVNAALSLCPARRPNLQEGIAILKFLCPDSPGDFGGGPGDIGGDGRVVGGHRDPSSDDWRSRWSLGHRW
nr:L-type lectin-domain containing receptor kinase V.7-like [Procambarus clarkii]